MQPPEGLISQHNVLSNCCNDQADCEVAAEVFAKAICNACACVLLINY